MTTAVAIVSDTEIVIAADRRITWGGAQTQPGIDCSKIYHWGDTIVVGAGSTIVGDAAEAYFATVSAPEIQCRLDVFDAFRNMYAHLTEILPTPPHEQECEWIIACPAGLWYVGSDGSVIEARHYLAIGSGSAHALGAIAAMRMWGRGGPRLMARRAVEIAGEFDQCTGDGIDLETIERSI